MTSALRVTAAAIGLGAVLFGAPAFAQDKEPAMMGKTAMGPVLTDAKGMTLYVFANDARAQALLVAVYDNLGKGASGAAVQNLDLMLGLGG